MSDGDCSAGGLWAVDAGRSGALLRPQSQAIADPQLGQDMGRAQFALIDKAR
jgi:hypothetical protein